MEDRHGLLWLVTESQGLLCYDGKKVVRYFQGEDELGMVRGVCEDSEGRIYVATANAGMFRFSDRSESGGAMGGKSLVHIDGTGSKHISTLYVSHDNRILIGYDGLGLAIYDPKTGTVTDNPYYSRDVNLSTAKVYSICEDRNGNTWLGLLQKGIYMHPAKTTGFHYMGYKLGARNVIGSACVTSVLMSSNTLNWVGTDKDGLYCLDTKGQVVKHFKEGFPATILGMAEDKAGPHLDRHFQGGLRMDRLSDTDLPSLSVAAGQGGQRVRPAHRPQGAVVAGYDGLWLVAAGR